MGCDFNLLKFKRHTDDWLSVWSAAASGIPHDAAFNADGAGQPESGAAAADAAAGMPEVTGAAANAGWPAMYGGGMVATRSVKRRAMSPRGVSVAGCAFRRWRYKTASDISKITAHAKRIRRVFIKA